MTERRSHTQHTVLVVDDEAPVLAVMRQLLTRTGLTVVTAENADQAFAVLAQQIPCLVMADVMMPVIDGLQLCRHITTDPRTAHVPVMLVTGRTDEADVREGMAAGASDYVKKPFDRDEVRMRVLTQIRLHETRLTQERLDKHLAVISAAAKDAIVIVDQEANILHWNRAAEVMFEYPAGEAVGRNVHELLTPVRLQDEHLRIFADMQAEGEGAIAGRTFESSALRKSGEEFPIEVSVSTARIDSDWCAVGIARDITTRRRLEHTLRQSDEQHRLLFNASRDALMTMGPPWTTFTTCNTATVELFGASSVAEFCACGPPDVSPPYQPDGRPSSEAAREMIVKALEEGSAHFEWTHQHIDGTPFPADVLLTRMERDRQPFVHATVRDISERRRLENELGHARKLEAVGQLAAGIAHEINTPTQYVGDSVHFLEEAFEGLRQVIRELRRAADALREAGGHDALLRDVDQTIAAVDLEYLESNVPDSLHRCLDGIHRISTIVLAMKDFAHPDQREKTSADLNKAIGSTLVIARNEYKYVADVETCFGELPPVRCHLGDLNQVFLNLIVNAAHAIGDVVAGTSNRGRIRVTTHRIGAFVRIDISDTGTGIPDAVRARVFEPFFTTKEAGKGSGQGLAIARTILVNKHHGKLTFTTEPGVGTTFTMTLPIDGIDGGCVQEES